MSESLNRKGKRHREREYQELLREENLNWLIHCSTNFEKKEKHMPSSTSHVGLKGDSGNFASPEGLQIDDSENEYLMESAELFDSVHSKVLRYGCDEPVHDGVLPKAQLQSFSDDAYFNSEENSFHCNSNPENFGNTSSIVVNNISSTSGCDGDLGINVSSEVDLVFGNNIDKDCELEQAVENESFSKSDSSSMEDDEYLSPTFSISDGQSTSTPPLEQLFPSHISDQNSESEPASLSLSKELAIWTVKNSINLSALDNLLNILRRHNNPDLPKCAKTLLKTPRTRLSGREVDTATNETVEIDVFVDGISPYKSSKVHLWVIAGCLVKKKTPFVIALWCGKIHEPNDINIFLDDYINEASLLMEKGFNYNERPYKFKVRNYIADAPARAWIRQVKPYNAYFGCERCTSNGVWLGRVTYDPNVKGTLRTDESLHNQDQNVHHIGVTPLLRLGTKLISQCPLEPMHKVYLGVVRRILSRLLSPKKSSCKLNKQLVEDLSLYSLSLSLFFPSEFARKPRPLSEWKLYKGTEFRRLLLYDGFLLFQNMGNHKLTVIHSLLACAIRILSDSNLVHEFWKDADVLLRLFVKKSCKLFTNTFNVFNVHNMIHLASECSLHGNLEEFSAWKFESYLGQVKGLLHAPGKTLPQIVCRLLERIAVLSEKDNLPLEPILEQPHNNGPTLVHGKQFRKLKLPSLVLRISVNDAFMRTKTNNIVVVRNIIQCTNGIYLLGNAFKMMTSFFQYPFPSEVLGIYKVMELGPLESWPASDIKQKIVLLPLSKPAPSNPTLNWMDDTECLCLPMLHFE